MQIYKSIHLNLTLVLLYITLIQFYEAKYEEDVFEILENYFWKYLRSNKA